MLLKNKFLNSIKYYLNNKKDFYSRTEMLNDLILHNKYKSYLEIGVNTSRQPGYNWTGLRCLVKHGVDPNVDTTYNMDSDTFFQDYITQKYDICFIDGLHLHEQCYRDIINCLKNLNQDGCIVVHDCNPIHELTQRRVRASSVWHGDIWKSILKLRQNHDNLEVCTVDTDEGCAYIKFGSQKKLNHLLDSETLEFEYFDKNRKELLNLISVDDFKRRFLT